MRSTGPEGRRGGTAAATEPRRGLLRRAPHPDLRGLVTAYHGYRYDGLDPGVHHGLPDGTLTLVVAFDEPLDVAWSDDPGSRARHWVLVSGLHTEPALIRHDGAQHGIQTGLTPLGARRLLGAPAAALAGTFADLEMPQAYARMLAADTWSDRFAALDAALLAKAAEHQDVRVRAEVARAWWRIRQTHGRVRVDDLAAEVGWSRRHLTGCFTAELGIGPKQAGRIERFRWARAGLEAGCPLAELAARCGYADQSHLDREFHALAGCTPSTWRREALTFVQDGSEPG